MENLCPCSRNALEQLQVLRGVDKCNGDIQSTTGHEPKKLQSDETLASQEYSPLGSQSTSTDLNSPSNRDTTLNQGPALCVGAFQQTCNAPSCKHITIIQSCHHLGMHVHSYIMPAESNSANQRTYQGKR